MKNIAAVIAIHERETITLKTVLRLKKQTYPINQIILIGESESEEQIAKQTDSIFLKHPNKPLSAKWQAGVDIARELSNDVVLIMGSDDWISENWCARMMIEIDKGYDLVGKNEIYFLNIEYNDLELIKWNGYNEPIERKNEPVGAGRIFSDNILSVIDWQRFPKILNGGLDKYSYFLTLAYGGSVKCVVDDSVSLIDIKSVYWKNKWGIEHIKSLSGVEIIHNIPDWLNVHFPDALEWIDKVRDEYSAHQNDDFVKKSN